MAPDLATYQQAALSVYEPQKAAEQASLTTAEQNTIAGLEAGKGQINTDYQQAINNLNNTIQQNVGQINQLYTERLGGNFSGLQGNDLGQMFSKANQQQSYIEQTRANKLNDIAVQEAGANATYQTNLSNLTSKYQGLESQYAQSSYASAVKQYETEAYHQAQLALAQERIGISAARAARSGGSTSLAAQKQSDMGTIASFLNSKVGRDGHVSQETWNAAMSQWLNAGYSAKDFVNSNMQFINQRYKGYHGFS